MTREQAKKMLPIITAWAEGEQLQIRTPGLAGELWHDVNEFHSNWDQCEYRVKPKPRVYYLHVTNYYNTEVWLGPEMDRPGVKEIIRVIEDMDWKPQPHIGYEQDP